jgi:hypothetical protein
MKLGFLTEKVGPFPTWSWILIGGLVYFFVIRPRLGGGTASAAAPSYVQVPAATGTTGTGNQPDFTPLTNALNNLTSQLQTTGPGTSTLPTTNLLNQNNPQPVAAPAAPIAPTAPVPTPVSQAIQAIQSTVPPAFTVYQPSLQASQPQVTYNANPPPPGLVPATVNVDLVRRLTANGMTPEQIAAFTGLSNPQAHSSLSSYGGH